ncbi:hypothetical protein BDV38DRAFT_287505 [Aspergillus pseudotamarii]|uniref:Uncharacterized protein n=1 Tax=Aspergillus pseudotamarii TaxID=132259 RepID=A0A5N6SG95_ASPPS|nr:uncharacterized protein BDV38DRAFT_287505 [Aspergillus pseudotamarii]KAE8132691.1 hypothetical protein BDV38DRAFT_287505 [Aspergillus pseudotamarii]
MQLRHRIHSDHCDPLDYPQTLDEAKERLRIQAEHTAQYARAVAEDFQEKAEQEMSYLSDEEINNEIDRMSQEAKEDIDRHIGETTEWLKAFTRNVARRDVGEEQERPLVRSVSKRQAGEEQGRTLIHCVKQAFHTAFKAITDCFRWICEKIRQGWSKFKEGVRWVVQEVKELVKRAISDIRQLFQVDVHSGYAL